MRGEGRGGETHHGECTGALMLEVEVLILELGAIDALASRAVASCEVARLWVCVGVRVRVTRTDKAGRVCGRVRVTRRVWEGHRGRMQLCCTHSLPQTRAATDCERDPLLWNKL